MAVALASTAVPRAATRPRRLRRRAASRGVAWAAAAPASASATPSDDNKNDIVIDVALKEWGAVVAALAAGKQTVIFRKGGLKDGGKGGAVCTS
jgi:hypothetical protein